MQWINFEGVVSEVVAGFVVLLLTAIASFLFRIPSKLDQLSEDLNEFSKDAKSRLDKHRLFIDENRNRIDLHDLLWSKQLKKTVRTDLMAKGKISLDEAPIQDGSD